MIVRERRREIGVLKAIGASNINITIQFVIESLVLTLCGAIVGTIVGVFANNPVLKSFGSSLVRPLSLSGGIRRDDANGTGLYGQCCSGVTAIVNTILFFMAYWPL